MCDDVLSNAAGFLVARSEWRVLTILIKASELRFRKYLQHLKALDHYIIARLLLFYYYI